MKKSFNILYLANSGDIIGGGQISLIELINRLNRKRFYPLIICPAAGKLFDKLNEMGNETQIIKMGTLRNMNIFSWLKTVNKLIQLIKRRKIDLIHSNGSRSAIFGGVAARLTRTPLIWHVRIADRDKLLDRFLARLSTKIIAISKAVKKRFDWLKDNKIDIIYNGIDLRKFNPAIKGEKIKEEFHLSFNTPLVGIVGRLDWYKGHQYFLKAAKKVTETIPEAHFFIVGDGEYRTRLEDQVKQLNLDKNVIFTGNRADIPEIIAGIDLFVLSSVSEGFGRVVAEAMACGKPVVATNVGGLSEVVKNGITGILVPSRNPAALAEAMIEALSNKEKLEEMGIAGRRRVEEFFSIENNVKYTEELYESMLSG